MKQKIECCRCDKEIKEPDINCYCKKCISEMANFALVDSIVEYLEESFNKAKARREQLIRKMQKKSQK